MAASSKSISKPIFSIGAGTISAKASPCSTRTGASTRIARRGPGRWRRPAATIFWTKRAALPSMIGTSGPSMSMIAFQTPVPASAAIRCSTVETETPEALVSRVLSRVSLTRS